MSRFAVLVCVVVVCSTLAARGDSLTLQDGVNGYVGTVDTYLDGYNPTTSQGSAGSVVVDLGQGSDNSLPPAQALLRFNTLFGYAPGRIPFGSTIQSATLTVNTTNAGSGAQLYRAKTVWEESRTWANSFGANGIDNNGIEAEPISYASIGQNTQAQNVPLGPAAINVTADVAAWSAGAANLGWALVPHSPNGKDGWAFDSSESAGVKPSLTVNYTPPPAPVRAAPKNVILMLGDGMGLEAIRAAKMYQGASSFNFENFPHKGAMTHDNISGTTTDSAASATAMATGRKVVNGVISSVSATDPTELTTALEVLKARGKRTGLVTNATHITDASPSAFGAHTTSRYSESEIAADFLAQSRPNVLFGQPGGMTVSAATAAGYHVVTTPGQLDALGPGEYEFNSGQFPSGAEPALEVATTKALNILDQGSNGFFLFVETEEADNGGDDNDIAGVVSGVSKFVKAVDAALTWAAGRDDTLIIVLADHEDGGLYGLVDNGPGALPGASWTKTGHTSLPVGVFATGPNSDMVLGTLDNTDIFHILTAVPEPSGLALALIGALAVLRRRH